MECNKCNSIVPLEQTSVIEDQPKEPECNNLSVFDCANIVTEKCCNEGVKISDMPEPCSIDGDDLIPLVHNGINVAVSVNKFIDLISKLIKDKQ